MPTSHVALGVPSQSLADGPERDEREPLGHLTLTSQVQHHRTGHHGLAGRGGSFLRGAAEPAVNLDGALHLLRTWSWATVAGGLSSLISAVWLGGGIYPSLPALP
jgi:hypothetical protein